MQSLLKEIRHNPLLWLLVLVAVRPAGTYARCEGKSSGADQLGHKGLEAGGRQLG